MEMVFIIGLILLGILFLVIEVFLIPGISIAGVAGVGCMVGGIVVAYTKLGVTGGTWVLGISVLVLGIVLYLFFRSKTLDKMSLKTNIESRVEPLNGQVFKPGDKGITISRLAPGGKVKIGESIVEGKSENEMIDENTPVEVVEAGTYNVTVKRISDINQS